MKYILAFIAAVIGSVTVHLFGGPNWADWLARFVGLIIGYQIGAFISYTKASPKKLLDMHPPGSRLMMSASIGEVEALVHQLKTGGLIHDFDLKNATLKVNQTKWDELTFENKKALHELSERFRSLTSGSHRFVEIKSETGLPIIPVVGLGQESVRTALSEGVALALAKNSLDDIAKAKIRIIERSEGRFAAETIKKIIEIRGRPVTAHEPGLHTYALRAAYSKAGIVEAFWDDGRYAIIIFEFTVSDSTWHLAHKLVPIPQYK